LLEELEGGDPGLLAREREAYCSKILTSRLYDALFPAAQAVARRFALSVLPIPADAAAILADLTEAEVAGPLAEGVAYGLLQRFDEPDLPSLYHPPASSAPGSPPPSGWARTRRKPSTPTWRRSGGRATRQIARPSCGSPSSPSSKPAANTPVKPRTCRRSNGPPSCWPGGYQCVASGTRRGDCSKRSARRPETLLPGTS